MEKAQADELRRKPGGNARRAFLHELVRRSS
jgi:hypothetical protein